MEETLERYLDEEGRVTRWPGRKHKQDQEVILDYLASKFTPGKRYHERDVNAILSQFHTFEDWAMLRRELFERGYFNRTKDGAVYWPTPQTKLY